MARAERTPDYDLDALRERVSIGDVLGERRLKGRCACPVHGGSNPSSFSYNQERWHCFTCEAGGDVFALVQALRSVDFKGAVAIVAQLAGLSVDQLPRIESPEAERRSRERRVRRALHAWRDRQLNELAGEICQLESDAAWVRERLTAARSRAGTDEPVWWSLLEDVCWALAVAEWRAELLARATDDELGLMWLETRGGVGQCAKR